LVLAGVVVWAR